MKKCPFCGMALNNTADYCKFCGKELPHKSHKKIFIVFAVLFVIMLGFTFSRPSDKPKSTPITAEENQKLIEDNKKLQEQHDKENANAPQSDPVAAKKPANKLTALESIEISDMKAVISSTGHYVNIDGSVKNVGIHTVHFIKMRYVSVDENGAVVDSSEFYVTGEVRPGESKTFSHIVKKTGTGKYKLSLEQARFK